MKTKSTILAAVLLASFNHSNLMANTVFLGDPSPANASCEQECIGKWESSIELGYVAVSGNTETETFNGRFGLSFEKQKWRHAGFLATQVSSTNDKQNDTETDAEKLTAQLKSDYQFTKSAYWYGLIDYDKTKDSGFEYQTSAATGAGYRFIKSDTHRLDGELGIGNRRSKDELTLETTSESITRVAGLYKWQITKTSNFEQSMSSESGSGNTITKSLTSLSANVMDSLALKLSYSLKHQSEVPVGNEKKETVTSFTIVYTF